MPSSDPSTLSRWTHAVKPASWPKLLVPMLLGQCLGAVNHCSLSLVALLTGIGFALFGGIYIVLMNDWADQRVDTIKRELYPDSSPKTIPDGILSARAVLFGGITSAALTLLSAAAGAVLLQRPRVLGFGVVCMLIFGAYSLPPLRLNYRGGGELLETLGVGAALPLFNMILQDPESPLRLDVLGAYVLLSLSSALASGLSDEVSDRRGGKRTAVTLLGNHAVRRLINLSVLGAAVWLVIAGLASGPRPLLPFLTALVLLWFLRRLVRLNPDATTGAFAAQRNLKKVLHYGIWLAGLVLGTGTVLEHCGLGLVLR